MIPSTLAQLHVGAGEEAVFCLIFFHQLSHRASDGRDSSHRPAEYSSPRNGCTCFVKPGLATSLSPALVNLKPL